MNFSIYVCVWVFEKRSLIGSCVVLGYLLLADCVQATATSFSDILTLLLHIIITIINPFLADHSAVIVHTHICSIYKYLQLICFLFKSKAVVLYLDQLSHALVLTPVYEGYQAGMEVGLGLDLKSNACIL